jgi:hypothetical protein
MFAIVIRIAGYFLPAAYAAAKKIAARGGGCGGEGQLERRALTP